MGSWRRDLRNQQIRQQKIDDNPPRCAACDKVLPKPRRYVPNVKYCDNNGACQKTVHRAKQREKAALRAARRLEVLEEGELYPEGRVRRGRVLTEITERLTPTEFAEWVDQDVTDASIIRKLGLTATPAAVGFARRAAYNDRLTQATNAHFAPQLSDLELLGPSDNVMGKLLADHPDQYEQKLDTLVDAFVNWRTKFFAAGFERAYITRQFHREWIRDTLDTIYTGGRQLILSPPRHGKTDLLIHFCVWLICRNPNIRILWVGPNGDIAENCLGQVRDLLETHKPLADAYLAPGETWAPQRKSSTSLWQRAKFTVANRTLPLKQPTMWCTGVGGKLLSIDADFIVVDDPADPDASYTPGGRAKIENWFKVKLITRKMHHTGLAMISSRVHPDDLYSEFIESESWRVRVDKAHDQGKCGHPLFSEHDPTTADCVLFPEINPLEYLRDQADVVGDALFEMMYLNQPRPDGSLIFDPELIYAKCVDNSRGLGLDGIGGSYRLVAGLDPAARGVQAAFLWAVSIGDPADAVFTDPRRTRRPDTYWMVDVETQQAGGIEGAIKVMVEWKQKYGADLWVIEDNSYQKVFWDDPRVKRVALENDLTLRPTHTGPNKHDPDFGVAGMAPAYHNGEINLPYAGLEAQRKTDALIRQLVNFTGDTVATQKRNQKSDILMASWFPFATVIKKWKRENRRATISYAQSSLDTYDYTFLGDPDTPNGDLPWAPTDYPY